MTATTRNETTHAGAGRDDRTGDRVRLAARHWTGARDDNPWSARARSLVPALAAQAPVHDRDGTFVHDGIDAVRDAGLLSMLVPIELGGGGASLAEACAVLAELARGCPATSLTLSMHSHLVAAQVWRYVGGLAAPVLTSVAAEQPFLVSTGAGDWLASGGSAVAVDGGYRVTARKAPSSGAPAGKVLVTSVRWDDAADGASVVHCSIPFDAPGVSIEATWDAMGMRGTGSHTVVLDDVFVPDSAVSLVRRADVWHPVWATVLGVALPLIMSTYVGVAEAAVELVAPLASRRADLPDTVALVGEMHTRLTAARDSVAAMITAADDFHFEATTEHADLALRRKSAAADACVDVVRLALELGGGVAYGRGIGIERLARDVQGCRHHPLPAARQRRFTGDLILGGAG